MLVSPERGIYKQPENNKDQENKMEEMLAQPQAAPHAASNEALETQSIVQNTYQIAEILQEHRTVGRARM